MAHDILKIPFADVYRLYLQKVERKGRTRDELDTVILWLTGYGAAELSDCLAAQTSVGEFFSHFPKINENAALITGTICGYRVEEIKDPMMQKIRYMDKLVDELAKGRPTDKILRGRR
jgi:hypothetical protein